MSSDPAVVADAEILGHHLAQLQDCIANIDKVRGVTKLPPAWIFIDAGTIISEQEARRDIARAPDLFARAKQVRTADNAHTARFYEAFRKSHVRPIEVTQSLAAFHADPNLVKDFCEPAEIKIDRPGIPG